MTPEAMPPARGNDELDQTRSAADGDAAAQGSESTSESAPEIDLDAMDLSVETAEERISPSETNVFDK